nr:PREDICTED: coiled-coil domain-containing protein 91 isoform X3 [Anolis carolinensis]|eukprot:XP_003221420.1 PREDICTED: coiled-coil domain-containing protein 91 isoform X3 [Anolis carolinensis]
MDDDDFGGFEAAETFKDGSGEPQTTSPAIPWAAFPAVSEIHMPQTVSAEILLEQPVTSSCLDSSHVAVSSVDDIRLDSQPSTIVLNSDDLKKQTPLSTSPSLEVAVSSLNLTEDLEAVTDENGDEELGLNDSDKHFQQTLSTLEVKLKTADDEKCRIKQELKDLLGKYEILETNFLKENEDKLISHQEEYDKIQEKHKLELEDLRRAGHEALTIIVEEFKALLQTVVQLRGEAIEKQYVSAIVKQAQKCEGLLLAQHQKLIDMLDKECEVLGKKSEESLFQQFQKYKEILENCMETERKTNEEALAAAIKIEKEEMQASVMTAIKAERESMEKLHAEEREIWKAERKKDHKEIAQAIENAVQEERQCNEATVKAVLIEQQQKCEKAIEEAVQQSRKELMVYIKNRKRLDQVIRQRSLSSLELFLSCAQKQVNSLLNEEYTATVTEQDKTSL